MSCRTYCGIDSNGTDAIIFATCGALRPIIQDSLKRRADNGSDSLLKLVDCEEVDHSHSAPELGVQEYRLRKVCASEKRTTATKSPFALEVNIGPTPLQLHSWQTENGAVNANTVFSAFSYHPPHHLSPFSVSWAYS
jgi:hypothetical protein